MQNPELLPRRHTNTERFEIFLAKLDPYNPELVRRSSLEIKSAIEWLKTHPQRAGFGPFGILHLVTSGFAAELQSGIRRLHQDIDLISLEEHPLHNLFERWHGDGDWVKPNTMHGDMKLDPLFLEKTAVTIHIPPPEDFEIITVSPAVNLVIKLADDENTDNEFARGPQKPRLTDIWDAVAILCSEYPKKQNWREELNVALLGLEPENRSKAQTRLDLLTGTIGVKEFRDAFLAVGKVWKEEIKPWLVFLTPAFDDAG